MSKKKLDEVTKIKLIYSGELLFFSIVFVVLATLQVVDVITLGEKFLNVFKFVTLLGFAYFTYDIITTFTNKKKRAKACLPDKFSTILVPPYILTVDILIFTKNDLVWSNPKYFIAPLFFYIAAAYLFQSIYHWFYPLKELFEDDEKKEENNENVVATIENPEVSEEKVEGTEENDKKDSN